MDIQLQVVAGNDSVTFTSPNRFSFLLPQQLKITNNRISLKSLRLYYSWYNISQAKNNNQFSYQWVDGVTHSVTFSDGIWTYKDAQAYLEQVMRARGHYLINSASQPVYFIKLQSNSVFYRISLTLTAVPTAVPDGWSAPAGWVAPSTLRTPLFIVPATAIQSYLGFPAGTYPSQSQETTYQANSPNVPQVTDISSLMLQSNCVKNEYGPDARTIATFNVTPGAEPGSLITVEPFYQDWIPMQHHLKLNTLELTIVDQNSRPVKIEDPAGFICTLNIQ